VIAACARGPSAPAVAEPSRVSACWVSQLTRQQRERGSLAPLPYGGYTRQARAGELERLQQSVKDPPEATLEERRVALGLKGHRSVLWGVLDRLQLTVSKPL
jgi:transposase